MRPFKTKEEIERYARDVAQGDFGCLLTEVSGQALIAVKIRVTIDVGYNIGRMD